MLSFSHISPSAVALSLERQIECYSLHSFLGLTMGGGPTPKDGHVHSCRQRKNSATSAPFASGSFLRRLIPVRKAPLVCLWLILFLLLKVLKESCPAAAFCLKRSLYSSAVLPNPRCEGPRWLTVCTQGNNTPGLAHELGAHRRMQRGMTRRGYIQAAEGGGAAVDTADNSPQEGSRRRLSAPLAAADGLESTLDRTSSGSQDSAGLGGCPSRAEVQSFFSFLLASMSPPPPQQQRQQQQRVLPNLAAAVDGVLFLAACAVSPRWILSLAPAEQSPLGPRKDSLGVAGGGSSARQKQQQDWLLLCSPAFNAHPPETLPLRALTAFFVSLRQLLPRLPQSAITRLIAPLFALGRSIAFGSHVLPEVPEEVRAVAEALVLLLHGVLQRAAEEAPTLLPGDTVQRVSTACNALTDWSKRLSPSNGGRLVPLLLLGAPPSLQYPIQEEDLLEAPASGVPGCGAAAALALALHRTGASPLPWNILRATASMIEASAAAAARGLQAVGASHQHVAGIVEAPSRLDQRRDYPQEARSQHQQKVKQEQQKLQVGVSPALQTAAEELRQLVTARASWLPVYYLLMRLNGGIWLPAVQQLAEAAAAQGARLIELFISQQQRQRSVREAEETQSAAWAAVGRMLYLEVQQLSISLARLHSLRPLRGMGHFAASAVAFDRFLHEQQISSSQDKGVTGAPGSSGETVVPFLRPLLHTHDPPRDLKEAERRIRFFCSLVTLGATDSSLLSGVTVCLPSEGQINSSNFSSTHQPPQKQQPSSSRVTAAKQISVKLLQRLLFAWSWVGEWPLVVMGLKLLRHRLESLTLQRLLGASTPASSGRGGRNFERTQGKAAAEEDADERNTAELVGKTLALLQKNLNAKWRSFKGGKSSRLTSPPRSEGETSELQEALCSLAATATLWAAVSGFEKQRPEDIALLTFSLIPFWIQETTEGAAPVHTQQQVQTIRAGAAAAAPSADTGTTQEHENSQQQYRQRLQDGANFAALARSLKGFHTFSSASGVSPARYVDSSAVEFYLSELLEKKGADLNMWPSPLLFLLAYNILRLRRNKGNDTFRASFDATTSIGTASAETASPQGHSIGASSAAQQHSQQLTSEAEATAAQLLLRVVAAIDESISFPESVYGWYRAGGSGGPPDGAVKTPQDGGSSPFSLSTLPGNTPQSRTDVSVVATSGASDSPRQAGIGRAGMREVGSFLWALNRAEGGLGVPEIMDTAGASTESTPSPFDNSERHVKVLTLQQAARLAAHNIRRPGGFADKLALYCEAAIRAANDSFLQRAGTLPTPKDLTLDIGKARQQRPFASPAAAVACGEVATSGGEGDLEGDYRPQTVLKKLKRYCLRAPAMFKSPIALRRQDRLPMSWVSTAGVSIGLLLSFFSSCRAETRSHILSGIVHAPLLAAECGLLQLFHLLRPLAAAVRAIPDESELMISETENRDPVDVSPPPAGGACDPSTVEAPTTEQVVGPKTGRHSTSILRLLHGAPAFLFAVTAALLRHAQSIAALPADSPRTAAQVQLLLLAASDFATLLHAHCRFTAAGAAEIEAEKDRGAGAAPRISAVTTSVEFRGVLQELLSIFSNLVVRHASQIRDSLALLAAAAQILSLCGRYVPLPAGSKKALEAFAPAAMAALRQPPPYQAGPGRFSGTSSPQPQRGGGAEELRRLATALEALKFVQLK